MMLERGCSMTMYPSAIPSRRRYRTDVMIVVWTRPKLVGLDLASRYPREIADEVAVLAAKVTMVWARHGIAIVGMHGA